MQEIASRLATIREKIDAALARAGDPAREVTIVAVTKKMPATVVDAVAAAGLRDIGENRVVEALGKAEEVTADVRWHLIGHLQRNKAARAAAFFSVIHAVDSTRLAEALGAAAGSPDVFLQVNVSGESAKHGAAPGDARELWQTALRGGLRVVGLMTMAPWTEDPDAVRPVFRGLRELRDELNRHGDGPSLRCLSMGMSGDFEIAVEEGATHVRIGTALVGGRFPQPR